MHPFLTGQGLHGMDTCGARRVGMRLIGVSVETSAGAYAGRERCLNRNGISAARSRLICAVTPKSVCWSSRVERKNSGSSRISGRCKRRWTIFGLTRSKDGSKVSTVPPTGATQMADAHATPAYNAPRTRTRCSLRIATSLVSTLGTGVALAGWLPTCPPPSCSPRQPATLQRAGTAPVRHCYGSATGRPL